MIGLKVPVLMTALVVGSFSQVNSTTTTTSSTMRAATTATATSAPRTTTPTTTTKTIAVPLGGRCESPRLETNIRFSLKSERNGTGPWVSTVMGERNTPTDVSGGDSCPWAVRVGHEGTTCPLLNRGVRLAATIEIESNVTDADVAALTDRLSEVPPPVTEYEVSLHHSEYKLDLRLVKWDLAHEFCQQEGGDLVVINSREEAAVLMKILRDHGQISEDPYENKQVWVGVHDRETEGKFVTVYGEPLSETGYEQWAIGEPNDMGSGEDCVSMLRYGNFNDEICTKKLAFICERPHYPTLYS